VITLVYSSLTTLRQTDFKCLVAYSNIAHMSVVVAGVFSNTIQGIEGGLMLSIAHGFVSPALFMLVGGVLYDRYHTRVIRYYRGMTSYMPIFAALFFAFTVANMGTPTTLLTSDRRFWRYTQPYHLKLSVGSINITMCDTSERMLRRQALL